MKFKIFAPVAALALATTLAACSNTSSDQPADSTSSHTTQSQSDKPSDSTKDSSSNSTSTSDSKTDTSKSDSKTDTSGDKVSASDIRSVAVSPTEAIDKAKADAGEGDVTSISLDEENRSWVYDVSIVNGNKEFDVHVDATTGEVLKKEEDSADDSEQAVDPSSPMTPEEAMDAALGEVQGTVTSWSLDSEGSDIYYDVEIHSDHGDVDVHVDVNTGNVQADN